MHIPEVSLTVERLNSEVGHSRCGLICGGLKGEHDISQVCSALRPLDAVVCQDAEHLGQLRRSSGGALAGCSDGENGVAQLRH